jgi:biotin transporter BioY
VNVNPKVAATGVAGSVTILLVWVAGMVGIPVPAEVASAFTVLVGFAAGYLKSA